MDLSVKDPEHRQQVWQESGVPGWLQTVTFILEGLSQVSPKVTGVIPRGAGIPECLG